MPVEIDKKELAKARHIFSGPVLQSIRRAFGRRAAVFFEFYGELKTIKLVGEAEKGLTRHYKFLSDLLLRTKMPADKQGLSPAVSNQVALSKSQMRPLLNRLVNGRLDAQTWKEINEVFVPLMLSVLKDKGIYLRAIQVGTERWARFRKMPVAEEYAEKLQDQDPEMYELMVLRGMAREEIEQNTANRITRAGMHHTRTFMMGKVTHIGRDPITDEEYVYDHDGEVLPVSDFKEKRLRRFEALKKLKRIPDKPNVRIDQLRSLSDSEVDELEGPIEWMSLTDDKAKQGRLTKILPTRRKTVFITDAGGTDTREESYLVIVDGRYKGVFLDDMVNSQGRLIEGRSFKFSRNNPKKVPVRSKIDVGQREPYVTVGSVQVTRRVNRKKVTVTEDRLYLKVPGSKQYTHIRLMLKDLACNAGKKGGCVPSITYHPVKGSRAAGFYFEPKDFGIIRDTLKGMSLSAQALKLVTGYYEDLVRAEQATRPENLAAFTAENLGGFVASKVNPKTGKRKAFKLNSAQKQSIAWLDANDNKGVLGLDTGVGKSLAGLGVMQKFVRDGVADPGVEYTRPDNRTVRTNGRFLYICPKALKGNLPGEIKAFLRNPNDLLSRVDIVTYLEFSGSSKSKKVPRSIRRVPYWKDREWEPAEYSAWIFDEAHLLKNPDSERAKAAAAYHPHKIFLTASPMEKEPEEAYVLAALANNKPLTSDTAEGAKNKAEMKRWKSRFCETIGGRIVGVKEDPLTKRDLDVWVKRNIFYADKMSVREYELKPPLRVNRGVEMDPAVEDLYRDMTGQFARLMRGLVGKFRDKGIGPDGHADPDARDPETERIFRNAYKPVVRLMDQLGNVPSVALRNIAEIIETGHLPWSGAPVPPQLRTIVSDWRKVHSPDRLKWLAEVVGNPKVDAAVAHVEEKRKNTDDASRSILFTDNKELCWETARAMSMKVPGKHLVALNDRIHILEGGEEVTEVKIELPLDTIAALVANPQKQDEVMDQTDGFSVHKLPFREKRYKLHPSLPAHPTLNPFMLKTDWQQFVLQHIVSDDAEYVSAALYGPSYSHGQNLQAFDTVVHLDRDSWNSETMKQRTARSWRQGQKAKVEEVIIDAVYQATDEGVPRSDADPTLDDVRRYFQQMQGDLFDSVIKGAQDTELGAEWAEIIQRHARNFSLNRQVMELMASPYVGRAFDV